jgi:SAM-dependent methyltransferase
MSNSGDNNSHSKVSSLRPKIVKTYNVTNTNTKWPYTSQDMARQDETEDTQFYKEPKFQRHLDEWALLSLQQFYAKETLDNPITAMQQNRNINIPSKQPVLMLDLCTSWMSHLPSCEILATQNRTRTVVGMGMNMEEMQANPQLQACNVQDLNQNQALQGMDDGIYDAVLMTCAVDYLTKPQPVFQEIYRTLRPNGGTVLISFSNRYFAKKAVAVWLNAGQQQQSTVEVISKRKRNVNGERVDVSAKNAQDYIAAKARMDIVANYMLYSTADADNNTNGEGGWRSVEALDIKLDPTLDNIWLFLKQGPESVWRWFVFCIFRGTWQTDPLYVVKAVKE